MKNEGNEPDLKFRGALSRQQTAIYLSISLSEIDRLVRSNQIPKIKIGRRTLFRVVDLDAFLAKILPDSEKKGSKVSKRCPVYKKSKDRVDPTARHFGGSRSTCLVGNERPSAWEP